MFVKSKLLSITVILTFVTTVTCGTSRDSQSWISGNTKPLSGLKKSVMRVENENLNLRPRRDVESMNEFWSTFENVKKTQMLNFVKNYGNLNNTLLPHNVFKCPPCVCTNISSHLVSVLCDSAPITSIPQNWSFEIHELSLYYCNRLKVLDLSNLSIYTSLIRVKIKSYSLVQVLRTSHLNISSKLIELDLAMNRITTVEKNSFLLLTHLHVLSLRLNKITKLTKQMFTGLNRLRSLSISNNNINFIAYDTFDDLGNLVFLDISYNKIVPIGHDLLPVRTFMPLVNLEQLYTNDLCRDKPHQCSTFTNKALRVLTNLKLLRIDGDDRSGLGEEVKRLVQLRSLILTTDNVYNFTNESYFDNVPFINTLVFSGCFPHNVNPKAFTKLNNLVKFTYSLEDGRTNLCHILSDVQYLLNSSLKYLTLRGVNDRKCGCKTLKDEDAKYLTLFKLFELNLSYNNLLYLSSGFIAMLPASLKKIDLSGNSFSSNMVSKFHIFPKEMIELNLNNQYYDYYECNGYEKVREISGTETTLNSSTDLFTWKAVSKNSLRKQGLKYIKTEHKIETKKFSVNYSPHKLRILRGNKFRDLGRHVLGLDFSKCSINELSLAGGENTRWALFNLSSKIEIADFNSNFADKFNPNFFPENSSIRYFSMSKNLFGRAFQFDKDRLLFANTKQLIALDMSHNVITDLARDYFRNLFKLYILDISKNKLQTINISFSHMTELTFLDLSANSITSISKRTRDDLDLIATDHRVSIDLTSNPLPCTCEGLELMKWMAFTNVYLLNQDFLLCRNEFHKVQEMGNIVQLVETLQRQCAPKTVIILTNVFSIILFLFILLISMMYRYSGI